MNAVANLKPAIEFRIYAVGVNEVGRSVVWGMLNGAKVEIPTNVVTMAQLAAKGVPVINGQG